MQPSSQQPSPDIEAAQWRGRIATFSLLAATVIGLGLCGLLAFPFLAPLAWALALAVLFIPLHRVVESRIKRPDLAAMLSVLAVAVIVVAPALFLAERLVGEAQKGAAVIRAAVESGSWRQAVAQYPQLESVTQWFEKQFDIPGTVRDVTSRLTNMGAAVLRGSVRQLAGVLLTFYLLFYFLRDRLAALDAMRRLSPLGSAQTNRFFNRIADTILATVYGTLAVAVVQGTLGGLMFWWLDLPAPLLWGLVMALLATVPVLGAFLVWIPAAIFLLLAGRWGGALIMTVWGAVVVGGIDNVLYPVLVGGRLKLHTVPAFISIVGGLALFGSSGLILGPLMLTVTVFLLETWRMRLDDTGTAQESI